MRQVMFDMMDLRAKRLARKGSSEGRLDRGGLADVANAVEYEAEIGAVCEHETKAAEMIDPGVPIDGNVVKLSRLEACLGETPTNCLGRKTGPVLDAAKAFLFGGSDELPVANEARRGITMIRI